MKEVIKTLEKKNIMFSILLIVLGALLTWKPIGFIKTIVIVIGAVLFIMSIIDFLAYFNSDQNINNANLFKGIIELIASILLIFRNDVLIDLFPIIIGVVLIFNNIFKMQIALDIKKVDNNKWTYGFVSSLVCILIGVVIILNPFNTLEFVVRLAGIILLISEIAGLIYTMLVLKTIKVVIDAVDVEVKDAEPETKVIEAEVTEVSEPEEPKKKNQKDKKKKKDTK
jgi:uncharacterized membrane protein HdeD (DUF308 family)